MLSFHEEVPLNAGRLPPAATHLCLRVANACKGLLEPWG